LQEHHEAGEVHGVVGDAVAVLEPALGQAALDRHLAALEPHGDRGAGAALLALVALGRGAAVAGALAAADPLPALGRARGGLELAEVHQEWGLKTPESRRAGRRREADS